LVVAQFCRHERFLGAEANQGNKEGQFLRWLRFLLFTSWNRSLTFDFPICVHLHLRAIPDSVRAALRSL
jgi:hypothetical protein